MAQEKTTQEQNSNKNSRINRIVEFANNRQNQIILGSFLVLFSLFLIVAFTSFFFSWQEDQSTLGHFQDRSINTKNLLGKIGAGLSNFFIYDGFGIAAYIIPLIVSISGIRLFMRFKIRRILPLINWNLLAMLWLSIVIGFVGKKMALLSGIIGLEVNEYLQNFIGKTGLAIVLFFLLITYLVIRFKVTPDSFIEKIKEEKTKKETETSTKIESQKNRKNTYNETQKTSISTTQERKSEFEKSIKDLQPTINKYSSAKATNEDTVAFQIQKPFNEEQIEPVLKTVTPTLANAQIPVKKEPKITMKVTTPIKEEVPEPIKEIVQDSLKVITPKPIEKGVKIAVKEIVEEKSTTENLSDKLIQDFGEFDPTLELSDFKFPTFNLLKQYNETISIDPEELDINKDRIVYTLKNYKIGISEIKATVGPTITLYEIVPEAGVRISKIKNLEDDIALSLSALGIRIIAPIPGKGTIGIEVPNRKSTIVSMHSVITSKKFQESQMELPIALGKTISNETLVVDLAKMPHLLMAGATGQGKSVGLNAVLTSLLYRKHPAEVKFVLIDPKKVELTLFNKIERHYLAKLPDIDEAIITDTSKVVTTLNSLCVEMDNRYDLLKLAMVRNLKEYNGKFKERKLNPENGHKFLPYIVIVIDEFADLIMTAGKEVETPIARLAQLARAIGIHLIVATQRPSVNVITGIIKANFPARIAFRVTSKIDSRTILDAPGADQLIGRGDLLYSGGNDIVRVQCAFVDTPEVEKITSFIGSQRAYPEAYLLPEVPGDDSGTNLDNDIADRDKLFRDAAEVIVTAQQGSASLLQRKLKLGYNRAGRIIDQLEAAGIVGSFEGSKARQVLIPDFIALDKLLEDEKK